MNSARGLWLLFCVALAMGAPARADEPEVEVALTAIADAKAKLVEQVKDAEAERAKLASLVEQWKAAEAGSLEAIRSYCVERSEKKVFSAERRAIYLLLAAHDPAVMKLRTGGIRLLVSPDPTSSNRSAPIRYAVVFEARAIGVQLAEPGDDGDWSLRLSLDPNNDFGGTLRIESGDGLVLPAFDVRARDPNKMATQTIDALIEAILSAVRDGKL